MTQQKIVPSDSSPVDKYALSQYCYENIKIRIEKLRKEQKEEVKMYCFLRNFDVENRYAKIFYYNSKSGNIYDFYGRFKSEFFLNGEKGLEKFVAENSIPEDFEYPCDEDVSVFLGKYLIRAFCFYAEDTAYLKDAIIHGYLSLDSSSENVLQILHKTFQGGERQAWQFERSSLKPLFYKPKSQVLLLKGFYNDWTLKALLDFHGPELMKEAVKVENSEINIFLEEYLLDQKNKKSSAIPEKPDENSTSSKNEEIEVETENDRDESEVSLASLHLDNNYNGELEQTSNISVSISENTDRTAQYNERLQVDCFSLEYCIIPTENSPLDAVVMEGNQGESEKLENNRRFEQTEIHSTLYDASEVGEVVIFSTIPAENVLSEVQNGPDKEEEMVLEARIEHIISPTASIKGNNDGPSYMSDPSSSDASSLMAVVSHAQKNTFMLIPDQETNRNITKTLIETNLNSNMQISGSSSVTLAGNLKNDDSISTSQTISHSEIVTIETITDKLVADITENASPLTSKNIILVRDDPNKLPTLPILSENQNEYDDENKVILAAEIERGIPPITVNEEIKNDSSLNHKQNSENITEFITNTGSSLVTSVEHVANGDFCTTSQVSSNNENIINTDTEHVIAAILEKASHLTSNDTDVASIENNLSQNADTEELRDIELSNLPEKSSDASLTSAAISHPQEKISCSLGHKQNLVGNVEDEDPIKTSQISFHADNITMKTDTDHVISKITEKLLPSAMRTANCDHNLVMVKTSELQTALKKLQSATKKLVDKKEHNQLEAKMTKMLESVCENVTMTNSSDSSIAKIIESSSKSNLNVSWASFQHEIDRSLTKLSMMEEQYSGVGDRGSSSKTLDQEVELVEHEVAFVFNCRADYPNESIERINDVKILNAVVYCYWTSVKLNLRVATGIAKAFCAKRVKQLQSIINPTFSMIARALNYEKLSKSNLTTEEIEKLCFLHKTFNTRLFGYYENVIFYVQAVKEYQKIDPGFLSKNNSEN